ncbi:MAG: hypothetical protein WC489_06060 [Patescibacteria group bacterium]|jgi:type IV secretory pathway VirB6-like protein
MGRFGAIFMLMVLFVGVFGLSMVGIKIMSEDTEFNETGNPEEYQAHQQGTQLFQGLLSGWTGILIIIIVIMCFVALGMIFGRGGR